MVLQGPTEGLYNVLSYYIYNMISTEKRRCHMISFIIDNNISSAKTRSDLSE